MTARLLEVTDLSIAFDTPDGLVEAVRGLSFGVDRGKTLAIVGESGSGKTVAAYALLRLLRGARITGRAMFDGSDLLTIDDKSLRAIRGAKIAMVFQHPHASFHPAMRIVTQVAEVIRIHTPASRKEARERAIALLERVGIPDAERRADDYPHQFSGGMLQRVMIAMAIALNPSLIVADEPTTALDVTVQAQILQLLRDVQHEIGTALIVITHDIGVVANIAHDVLVMYAGKAMEYANRRTLLTAPHHPYTRALLAALPLLATDHEQLAAIPGQPPSPIAPAVGCPFQPRCEFAMPQCDSAPPLATIAHDATHRSACWLPADHAASVTT